MTIEVRLFATLRAGRGKVLSIETAEGSLVGDVIDKVGIDLGEIAILLVNGRTGRPEMVLDEEDYLSLFPPIGGG